MKRLLALLILLSSFTAIAQIDRTKLPEPAPARAFEIGDYEKFTLKNGLTVILAENHKLPSTAFTLTFNTGPITEGDKAGYSGIFGQVMRAGTTSKNKEVLNEEIDFMGASVNVGATSISAFSLSKYSEDVLKIMTDILYNPAFPQDEFDRAIEQSLTNLQTTKDDPNSISGNLSGILNYGADHPYGEIVTEETVKNISIDDLKNHYEKYFNPSIAYLVIVGDIDAKTAKKYAKEYFESWVNKAVEKEEFPAPKSIDETVISFVDRPSSVQSVINITYTVDNKPGNPDATKLQVMNQILGGGASARLFTNLREDKGYTYGAYSGLGSSRYSASFSANASVRNEVTDSSLVQFMYELKRIATEPVSQDELDLARNFLKGTFARNLENRTTVAQFALNTQLNNLPEDYYATYLQRLDAITIEDIQDVASRYIRPDKANVVIVGKAEEITDQLRSMAPINFYDTELNPIDDPANKVVADIAPADILNKYIEAIGGRDAVDAIQTLEYKSEATLNMGGQSINLTRTVYQKAPDKFLDVTVIPMMGEQKQIYSGGNAKVVAGGQTVPLAGVQAAPLKYLGVLFAERFYGDLGYNAEYKGTQKVDGKDAHRIDITIDGASFKEFYDVESGLKVQADLGQSGVYTMSDYKEVNGVMIPFKLVVKSQQIPVPLEFVISEAKANEEIDDSKFE